MQSMKPIVFFFSESADELALRGSAKCIFVALRLPPSMRNLLDASCAAGSRPSKEPAPHQFAAQRVERCSAYLKAKLPPVSKLSMCPRSLTSWDTAAACSTSRTALPCHRTIAAEPHAALLPWRRRPPIPYPRRRPVSGTPCGACRPPVSLLSVAQPPAHELVRGGARQGGRRA